MQRARQRWTKLSPDCAGIGRIFWSRIHDGILGFHVKENQTGHKRVASGPRMEDALHAVGDEPGGEVSYAATPEFGVSDVTAWQRSVDDLWSTPVGWWSIDFEYLEDAVVER